MNLYNELKNKDINIAIQFYGVNDLFTRWECTDLIKYFDIVKNLIENIEFESIINLNDYINYLLLVKISSFSEMIDIIIAEDNKSKISTLSNIAKDKIKSVTVQDLIKYINSTYIDLYDFDLSKINPEMNFQLFYLYVCILNSVFLDCIND